MDKYTTTLDLLHRCTKGARLRAGICDLIVGELLGSIAHLLDDATLTDSVYQTWFIPHTPRGWCEIDHYGLVVQFRDGKGLLDVPMSEYTTRNTCNSDEMSFWWKGNDRVQVHIMRSARDILEAYDCKWSEAKDIAEGIRDSEDIEYKINMTIDEFLNQHNQSSSQGDYHE